MMGLFGKKKGKTAEDWFELGYKEKDPEKIEEYYMDASEIDPEDAIAWNKKGNSLSNLKKYEEAIRCYDKALEINPAYHVALVNKAQALSKLELYDESIRCLDRALEIAPESAVARDIKEVIEEEFERATASRRERKRLKRLEREWKVREEERRKLEYERRISEPKAKYERYKREGYKPDYDLEEMLK